MTTPAKDNAHILADQEAFMAAYERARAALGALDGVLGVGFGQKQTGGTFTDDVGIIVFVAAKKPDAEIAPEERVPTVFEGYRTDVRTVVEKVPGGCDNDTSYSTIQGGIQIEAGTVASGTLAFGTLGCIVRRRGDAGRENVYMLSNKHVLYSGGASAGHYLYHPYVPSGNRASDVLGPIQNLAWYENRSSTVPGPGGTTVTDMFFVDAATARLDIDSKCCGSTCTKDTTKYATSVVDLQVGGQDTFTDVRSVARDPSIVVPTGPGGPFVYKVGRTTGKTRGIVRSINVIVNTVGDPSIPNSGTYQALNMIEIDFDPTSTSNGLNCHGKPYFAEHGDSGSIVVDENRRVIGLISQVPDPSLPGNSATACHILPVLDHLGICIPTTGGTSHGSCGATDGSGIPTTTATAATAATPDAAPEFAGAALGLGAPDAAAGPPPVSDAERDHMVGLLDEFRRTPHARELHDLFGQVRREIGYLVRNNRRVKIAWHRGQGPGFLTHTLNHLRGNAATVPVEVDGVPRVQLLSRMADALAAHGSIPLRAAVERHRDALLPILATATTIPEAIALLEAAASQDPAAIPRPSAG